MNQNVQNKMIYQFVCLVQSRQDNRNELNFIHIFQFRSAVSFMSVSEL